MLSVNSPTGEETKPVNGGPVGHFREISKKSKKKSKTKLRAKKMGSEGDDNAAQSQQGRDLRAITTAIWCT
jgi:hypothetical protein